MAANYPILDESYHKLQAERATSDFDRSYHLTAWSALVYGRVQGIDGPAMEGEDKRPVPIERELQAAIRDGRIYFRRFPMETSTDGDDVSTP